ncbi:MAG: hypothetical protein JNM57_04865 [Cyclobacteriaceae bacterium]|nr:hypothetical protein [Cyclobacteriaceae bacterium]
MKKTLTSAAVLMLLCLNNLVAQDKLHVSSTVSKKFETEFSGATNVRWEKIKGAVIARFNYHGDFNLAYFTESGEIISTGRKIKDVSQLPLSVQKGMANEQARCEKKFGPVALGAVYEMNEGTETYYYVPFQNGEVALMYSISSGGSSSLRRKELISSPISTNSALARNK